MPKENRKIRNILISTAVIACVMLALSVHFFYTRVTNATNKQALFLMATDLSAGDSKTKFYEIYAKYKTDKLQLIKINETQWLITMPPEFGATDWQMWVNFKNNEIIELKIRLSNGNNMHPYDAPPDKLGSYSE